jgi:hypothetical protein
MGGIWKCHVGSETILDVQDQEAGCQFFELGSKWI